MKKETKKAPTIRFRGFNDDWEQRKLEDFGRATGGISIESEFNKEGKYKVISIGNYSENSTYTDQGIRCNLTEKTQNRILNKNDLTMILNDKTAVGRIIGRVLLIEQDNSYVYNQRTERIEPNKNKYDPLFLYEMLNAPGIRSKIVRQCQGNTQIYVNWPVIANQKYKIPELKEQKIIGFFLKDLDHLITLHQRKLNQLKTLKKYFLQNMFPAKGEKVPRIRFKGFTGDWEQRKLGELAGKTYGGGTPRTSEKTFWNGQVPWFQSSDLIEDKVLSAIPKKKITEKGLQKSAAQLIPENSIAIITRVGVGKLAFIPFSYSTSQDFLSLSALNIDGKFGCYSIYKLLQREKNLTQGTSIKGITKKELLRKILWIPCQDEQIKIGRYIANIDNLITLHQRKLNQFQTMKKFMLQNLFI